MPETRTVGAVPSILMVAALSVSTFPALSTERYRTVWVPSPVTLTGSVYGVHGPPSTVYSVRATPDVASAADSVTGTPWLIHPSSFGGANCAVVSGAVASFLTDRVPLAVLPAASVARYATV